MPLLNILNSLIVLFFGLLFVWLPGWSALTGQEREMHELTGETNAPDTNENDSAITARVKEAIYREPKLKDEGSDVETHLGTVRLTGAVSSILVMEKAIEVVRGVKGVREVKDEMQFKWQY